MKKALLTVLVAVVTAARGSAADDVCKPDDEPCNFAKTWIGVLHADVAGTNTGVGSLVSPTQSATKDFLSKLTASLSVPMSGSGARPLTIDYNLPLLTGQRIKLQTTLAKPELSGDLRQRLGSNATAVKSLNDSLSELDDVSVSAALDASTRRYGRNLDPHRDAYLVMLKAVKDQSTFANQFAFLLNHQPQIYGSVLYHDRKDIAGPKERSARVTYEMGFSNLNDFYKRCESVTSTNAAQCAAAVQNIAGDGKSADDRADRLSMSVEYRASGGLTVALPQYSVNFHAANAHTFVYSLAWGRNRMMKEGDRIDVAVNYEDTTLSEAHDVVAPSRAGAAPFADVAVTTHAAVRDRFVASATYTYKISSMMSMPFSLIYANHASYLGDVGRKLNAHFGISLKMQ
jgi:hypothetical protein